MKKTTLFCLGFVFILLACDTDGYEPNQPADTNSTTADNNLQTKAVATEVAVAAFNVGSQYQNATGIAVYDVTGVQRLQQKVTGKQGEVQLNISYLSPGTYIVNLQADGVNIAQQKLIKK